MIPPTQCPRIFDFRSAALGCLIGAVLLSGSARADDAADVRALLGQGQTAAALTRVEQALKDRPGDTPLRFLHGVILMDLGRDAAALLRFTQLTQEHPDLPDPYNNLALLQARAGRLDEALAALQAALRSDPNHRTAQANLGQVHLMLAVRAWDALARGGPIDPALKQRLELVRNLVAPAPSVAR